MKYIGNNFWDNGDEVFNTKTQCFYPKKELPATMRFDKSMGNLQVLEEPAFEEGRKFVILSIVEGFRESMSGKSRFAKFDGFELLDLGKMKVDGAWLPYDENFKIGCVYILAIRVLEEKRLVLMSKKKLGK